MYAIREAFAGQIKTGRSADQSVDWWTGRAWQPAGDEAKVFDSAEAAEAHAREECTRPYVVVEIED